MNKRIRINNKLYEAVTDTDADYLPERDDIVSDIINARKSLEDNFKNNLSTTAKKDRELKKLFSNASIALADLKDYLRKNYTTIKHY